MNLKYFNGSVEDTFDFVLTSLNMISEHYESIVPDRDYFTIEINTTSYLTGDTIRLSMNFFTKGKRCVMTFTKKSGDLIEYMKKVKYYKKRIKKVLNALIKKEKRSKYEEKVKIEYNKAEDMKK